MRSCLILLVFVAGAAALCDLSTREPFPIVAKRIGSKTAILKGSSMLRFSLNETVTFYCPQGFKIFRDDDYPIIDLNGPTVELTCAEDGIYSNGQQISEWTSDGYIRCSTADSKSLFESSKSLSGCDADAMTLIVGYKLKGLSDVKQLAMCYDLSALRLRFVKFLAYQQKNLLLDMSQTDQVLNELKMDKYIDSLSEYFHFTSDEEFRQLKTNQIQLGALYDSELFDYSSLLQDQQQSKDFDNYKFLLNIVWLRSLRLGNWKHWLEALRVANDDNDEKFELRIGVSGVATLPLAHRCNVSRPMQLRDENGNALSVPAYIWAHVRSLQPSGNAADEFLLVAHNNPYVNVLELSAFCDDICAEIPWLKNSLFGELHLLPMYGVVHCCRMDQILKLPDSPFAKQQEESLLSATASTTTPTTDVSDSTTPSLEYFDDQH